MDKTVFSHRPKAGVSVGARNVNDSLIVAFSLVNDGTSRNGVFWNERRDSFCRATARNIIDGRINNVVDGGENQFTLVFATDLPAREFIAEYRRTFKPTPDETDEFASDEIVIGDAVVRFRKTANALADTVVALANAVVEDHESASL